MPEFDKSLFVVGPSTEKSLKEALEKFVLSYSRPRLKNLSNFFIPQLDVSSFSAEMLLEKYILKKLIFMHNILGYQI